VAAIQQSGDGDLVRGGLDGGAERWPTWLAWLHVVTRAGRPRRRERRRGRGQWS